MTVRTKTFKSGNSVALRLPKALGIKEGMEMTVREERGRYVIEPAQRPKRKFNIGKVAGSARNLQPIEDDARLFEERPLLWGQQPSTDGGQGDADEK